MTYTMVISILFDRNVCG